MRSYSSPAPAQGGARRGALAPLGIVLAAAWLNFALTGRWAAVPASLHGSKLPFYAAVLAVATVLYALTFRSRTATGAMGARARARLAAGILTGGVALLVTGALAAFPPATWRQIPFLDDWPGLLQLTLYGIELLGHGAVVGWQWAFLGGYHTSSDLSQSLALPALLPIVAFGPALGFHVFLGLITALVPLAVYADLRLDGDVDLARAGAGLASITTAGYFGTVMRTGMANSTAGAAFVALALLGSHAAQRGRRWGGPLMVASLTLTLYSHAAFYLYAAVLLGVEVLLTRNWRHARLGMFAGVTAFVAALPVHWELLRYPDWFISNNLAFDPANRFDWAGFASQLYYAAEILLRPGRWFNDYVGLTHVWLVAIAWVAWRDRSRARFYAWATLALVLLLRFNAPQLGLISSRQMHLLPVVVAPALAGFLLNGLVGGWPLRASLVAVIALYVAVPMTAVPHLPGVRAFDAALVDRLSSRDGHLVLLENNPHWDMIGSPGRSTEEPRFGVHYEALLPDATGRLFYGQPQDGFHRSRFRGHSLAGGGWRGRAIDEVPHDEFVAELRRWGVRWLFVWTELSRDYFARDPRFAVRWTSGAWTEYELLEADTRAVVTESGRGSLDSISPVGGRVILNGVRHGEPVVVRTHYFPAWSATAGGRDVPLYDADGQLAFRAPADGDVIVTLRYDRRTWLGVLALVAFGAGLALSHRLGRS